MEKTARALSFAEQAHIGQKRKASGLPYIVHCFNVYSIVREYKTSKNLDVVCAICILHDCLEDTDTTVSQLREMFGDIVADTVMELTNDPEQIAKVGKEEYLNQKLLGLSNYALTIKLADMLANVTDKPTMEMTKRIENHLRFLRNNRILTEPQINIAKHIDRIILGEYLQMALINRY